MNRPRKDDSTTKPATRAAPVKPEKRTWRGIPRDDIPWLPTVEAEACIGCQRCYVTCGRGVNETHDRVAVAVAPTERAVGCATCGNVRPTSAISVPTLGSVWTMERERQTVRTVKKSAMRKHEREDALKARAAAQAAVAYVPTHAKVELAGAFGDKRLLVHLEELIEGKPFDVMNLRRNACAGSADLPAEPSASLAGDQGRRLARPGRACHDGDQRADLALGVE